MKLHNCAYDFDINSNRNSSDLADVSQIWLTSLKYDWHSPSNLMDSLRIWMTHTFQLLFYLTTTIKTSFFLCWFMVGNKYHLHVQTRDTVVCYYLARGLPFVPVTPKGSFWASRICFFQQRSSFDKEGVQNIVHM